MVQVDGLGGFSNRRAMAMYFRRKGAAYAIQVAIKTGRLRPPKTLRCVDCGRQAACYDHRDYRRPLDVSPVCKKCDSRRGTAKPYCAIGTKEYAKILRKAMASYRPRMKRQRVQQIVKAGNGG